MSIIAVTSSKGGPGKTTCVCSLASEFAHLLGPHNLGVSILDLDKNQHSAHWASKGGCPDNITVFTKVDDEDVLDAIEEAQKANKIVLVDLEGTANVAATQAVSVADMVLVMTQASDLDAKEMQKTIKMVRNCERTLGKKINYAVCFNRQPAAIKTKITRWMIEDLEKAGVPVFDVKIIDREAFKNLTFYGGSFRSQLEQTTKSSEKRMILGAIENVKALIKEIDQRISSHVSKLKSTEESGVTEHV